MEFLGIKYHRDQDGNIHLSQEGVIKKILEITGLTNCKPNKTPGRKEPLGLDPDGPPMTESVPCIQLLLECYCTYLQITDRIYVIM